MFTGGVSALSHATVHAGEVGLFAEGKIMKL